MDNNFSEFMDKVNEMNRVQEEALKCVAYVYNRALHVKPEMRNYMIESIINFISKKDEKCAMH